MYTLSEVVPRIHHKFTLAAIAIYLAIALSSVTIGFLRVHQTNRITDFDMRYLEYLPPSYAHGNTTYPLIIYLHGHGEIGTKAADLYKIKRWGVPYHITNGHNMCFTVDGQEACFIVLSPQTSKKWDIAELDQFIEYAKKNYKVDQDRIYLTGISMGGQNTWFYAYSDFNKSNKLAAIAPVSGAGHPEKACIIAERNIPVWAFHVDEDYLIPLDSGKAAFNALMECDPAPNPDSHFTVYEYKPTESNGWKHNSWTRAYRTDNTLHTPNLFQWFLMHKRNERREGNGQTLAIQSYLKPQNLDVCLVAASPHL